MKNSILYCLFIGILFNGLQVKAQNLKYDVHATEVVAEIGYYQLSKGDLNASIEYMEFLLADQLSPKYRQAAQVALKQEFERNPQLIATEMEQLKYLLPQIAQMTNPTQIALYRNASIYQLQLNYWSVPQKPLVLQLLALHNPIIITDPLGNICLTQRDINALIEMAQFGNKVMGLPTKISDVERQQFIAELESKMYSMSLAKKQGLIVVADYLPQMRAYYANMTAKQRTDFQQEYRASITQSQLQAQQIADCQNCSESMKKIYAKQKNGTLTQADYAKAQREWHAQQNKYTTMSNISLENHVTILNIINNMGGGGDK